MALNIRNTTPDELFQLRVSAAHLSGTDICVRHRRGITKILSKMFCRRVPKNSVVGNHWFLIVSSIDNFHSSKGGGVSRFLESFLSHGTAKKSLGDPLAFLRTCLCLVLTILKCCKIHYRRKKRRKIVNSSL